MAWEIRLVALVIGVPAGCVFYYCGKRFWHAGKTFLSCPGCKDLLTSQANHILKTGCCRKCNQTLLFDPAAEPQTNLSPVPGTSKDRPIRKAFLVALGISAVLGGFHVLAAWLSVSGHGSDMWYKGSWLLIGFLLLTVLYNVLYVLFDGARWLLRLGKKVDPGRLGATAVFCVTCTFFLFIAIGIGETLRHSGLEALINRAEPLIAAIRKYENEHGSPPAALEQLVPNFFPAIPGTGVAAYPKYEYLTNQDASQYGGNHWILFVDISTDELSQDRLIYYPARNYPPSQPGARVRKIGGWAVFSIFKKSSGK